MVKRIDAMGRIVIPAELRRELNVNLGDEVSLELVDGTIVVRKNEAVCMLCGSKGRLTRSEKGDIVLCEDCIKRVKEAL